MRPFLACSERLFRKYNWEDTMAETKVQRQTSEQREITRRPDYYQSRDLFSFSPFSMMRRLSEEMDRAFGSSFGLTRGGGEFGMWSPPVDVRERDGNLEIHAELPGLAKEDVKVECTDEGIVIEGERRREQETDEGGWRRTERSYGRFYRMIPLPEGAQADQAKAEFKDGVLKVRVPVSEQQHRRSRQIPIGG
jgi:HSP20 family protein